MKQSYEVTTEKLLRYYEDVSQNLNACYSSENDVCPTERILINKILAQTNTKLIRNMWIGRRNIDLFLPQLAHGQFEGIAIELNGKIHNSEFKMKKDNFKNKALEDIFLLPISIDVNDLNHPHTSQIINMISRLKKLNKTQEERVLRRIYTKTILANRTNEELFQLFDSNEAQHLLAFRQKLNARCGLIRKNQLLKSGNSKKNFPLYGV